jgi:hypothetical protein
MYDDAVIKDAGAAFIFQRHHGGTNNWGEVKKLQAFDAQAVDYFGQSVGISGDTAVIGIWPAKGPNPGAAYVFQQDRGGTNNWGLVKRIVPADLQNGDEFGWSVGISGDTIAVGARYEDQAGSNAGAAYVFERDAGGVDNWGEVKKLVASDGETSDRLGQSVAVDGDTVLAGATHDADAGFVSGAAYVFERDAGGVDNWGEVKKLTASDTEAHDNFGWALAVSGETAVVGMYDWLDPKADVGAYVFQRNQGGAGNWGEVKKIADPSADETFARWVALNGDTAVIGAIGGSHVYWKDQGGVNNWGEIALLPKWSHVDVSGNTVLIGSGSAGYIFELGPVAPPPPPTVTPTPTATIDPTDTDEDGCPDQLENGSDPMKGGLRDWQNPHDFYDVNGDSTVDLPNDVLGVIFHYAPAGTEPNYDMNFDRGSTAGPNPWNMTAPDGVIDLSNDILGVVFQYFHNCQ